VLYGVVCVVLYCCNVDRWVSGVPVFFGCLFYCCLLFVLIPVVCLLLWACCVLLYCNALVMCFFVNRELILESVVIFCGWRPM